MDFHLNIFGKGVTKGFLQDKIRELGLEENVTLCGIRDDINVHLANSDIFLHTALYEPFGLVIIEAMAASLPVIALDGGGNKELIQNGVNGYLIKENDQDIFAEKIIECRQSDKYNTMSNGALKTSSQYDIVPYVSKLLDLYAQQP